MKKDITQKTQKSAEEILLLACNLSGINQSQLARLLKVSKQSIYMWKLQDAIPIKHCPTIERITHSRIKCEEIRNDVDWSCLRAS